MDAAMIVLIFALCGLLASVCESQFTIDVSLSETSLQLEDNVTITCRIANPAKKRFVLIWTRQISGHDVEIATNKFVNGVYRKTGRYAANYGNISSDLSRVTLELHISRLQTTDSGTIACKIAQSTAASSMELVVQAPVSTVTWYERGDNISEPRRPISGDNATSLQEGAAMPFSCVVNGSYPEPRVSVLAGDDDVTAMFRQTTELVAAGDRPEFQSLYYRVEVTAITLQMRYSYHRKRLTCIATLPGSQFAPRSGSFNLTVLGYKPKFRCSNIVVSHMHAANVQIRCIVHALPPPTHFEFYWRKLDSPQFGRLLPGGADGHYKATLIDGENDLEKLMVLDIDRLYRQAFRVYRFEARNEYGNETTSIELREEVAMAVNSAVTTRGMSSAVGLIACLLRATVGMLQSL